MSEPELEKRYRRLLVWYPWSHRRVYEDEMVAVLVAGASPGRRRPTVGETADLVVSGLRARMRGAFSGLTNPAWVDATAVFGLLAAMVLLSQRVVKLIKFAGIGAGGSEPQVYLRAIGWAAVVLAVVAGLRRSAAALAWITVLGEAVLAAGRYDTDPVSIVNLLWLLGLGVTVAVALTVPAPRRHALSVLGASRLLAFVVGLGLVQTVLVVNDYQAGAMWQRGPTTFYVFYGIESTSKTVLYLWIGAIAVGALAAGLAVLTLPAPARWRIAALAAPVAALAVAVTQTLQGWTRSNNSMDHPIYLVSVQWALLAAVPITVFALGAAFVHRHEQRSRLADLGRSVDRESFGG